VATPSLFEFAGSERRARPRRSFYEAVFGLEGKPAGPFSQLSLRGAQIAGAGPRGWIRQEDSPQPRPLYNKGLENLEAALAKFVAAPPPPPPGRIDPHSAGTARSDVIDARRSSMSPQKQSRPASLL